MPYLFLEKWLHTVVTELESVLCCQVLKRDTALATAAIYQSMFGLEDGSIPATFQVLYLSCWNKANQNLPLSEPELIQQHPFFSQQS
jgi:hypothetical protein